MEQPLDETLISERRIKPRICCNYPAIVRGHDAAGNQFKEQGIIENISAAGLYLKFHRLVEPGEKLNITVQFTDSPANDSALRLKTTGIVIRSEPQSDGDFGIAVKFQDYRLI